MDNCTLFPDRLFYLDWSHCCALHDIAYDLGVPRAQADAEFYQCVLDATGAGWFAGLMFCAVSAFGWIFYKKARGQ